MAPRMRYPVPDLEEWASPQYHIPRRRPFDGLVAFRPDDFETYDLRFEYSHLGDSAWRFQRMLGSGGFGLVGHWRKTDANGRPIDDLAVKEAWMPDSDMYRISSTSRPIPEEAIIQVDLMRKRCPPVLQLRGWNVISAPPGHAEKLRYYMQYCAHGTLDRILTHYFNEMEHDPDMIGEVPEPFLWQLLYNFAQVMLAMERLPFRHPLAATLGPNPYILHLDVKAENVFLAETEDEDIIKGYPACKVGDWGLATLVTMRHDTRNSLEIVNRGTDQWFPPEQYEDGTFGDTWANPPSWRVDDDTNAHPYTPAHSVFAFASIIFRLMVLDENLSYLDDALRDASYSEAGVHARNYRWIQSSHMDTNVLRLPTTYSEDLKDVIANCLNLDPDQRPTAAQLAQLARRKCEQLARLQLAGVIDNFRDLQVPSNGVDNW